MEKTDIDDKCNVESYSFSIIIKKSDNHILTRNEYSCGWTIFAPLCFMSVLEIVEENYEQTFFCLNSTKED